MLANRSLHLHRVDWPDAVNAKAEKVAEHIVARDNAAEAAVRDGFRASGIRLGERA